MYREMCKVGESSVHHRGGQLAALQPISGGIEALTMGHGKIRRNSVLKPELAKVDENRGDGGGGGGGGGDSGLGSISGNVDGLTTGIVYQPSTLQPIIIGGGGSGAMLLESGPPPVHDGGGSGRPPVPGGSSIRSISLGGNGVRGGVAAVDGRQLSASQSMGSGEASSSGKGGGMKRSGSEKSFLNAARPPNITYPNP